MSDVQTFGGTMNARGEADFGWIPYDRRDNNMVLAENLALSYMPRFDVKGKSRYDGRSFLWDIAKKANDGKHFETLFQETGSCVGNGGCNAVWYLSAMEVVRNHDPERVTFPFWLLPYGKSRQLAGLNGEGEGSLGSTFAQAIREYGILPGDDDDLPKPQFSTRGDGLTYGAAMERKWSNGRAIPDPFLERSRKHVVRTTAQVRTVEEFRAALLNFYPITIASSWGGQMQCRVENGVLMNYRSGVWNHQMCVIGFWDHPQQGEIFYVLNSWGRRAHGECPSGAPPGGFWVKKNEIDYIGRTGECYAFSQFDGFPAQELDWYF